MPFGFFAFSAAWLLLLIAPLVVLYFLKLRRPRVRIPSLVLWQQVLKDHRVNSPFQKFKRNILLLLQLLLLLMLILAAMQPFWRGGAARAQRLPILIDRSASMGALDAAGGSSRLDLARDKALQIIDKLAPDQQVSLIAFGRTARQVVGFTSNKRVLREALESIVLEDAPSNIGEALRMAEAMARTSPFERMVMFSDGNFPAELDYDLPFELDYQRLPTGGANIGITEVSAQRTPGGGWSVFVKVQATSDASIPATVELIQDGESRSEERVAVGSGSAQRLVFPVVSTQRTSLELRLKPQGFDSLAADNVAFLELLPPRPLWVYAPPSLADYRHALGVQTDLTLLPEGDEDPADATFDLVITDREDAPAAEAPVRFHVGVMPADLSDMLTVGEDGTSAVDWRRAAPLLEHVELAELVILDDPQFQAGFDERDLENLHYEVLAYGRRGPLILLRREGAAQSYYLLFHTDRSTLPYRVGFPILISNLVRVAKQQASLLDVQGDRTGVLPTVQAAPEQTCRITGPAGYDRQEQADGEGELVGVPAPRVGRYVVKRGGDEIARLGVSLLSAAESSLSSVERIEFGELAVEATGEPAKVDHSLWSLFVVLALCLLLVEWWYFHRPAGGRR